MVEMVFIAKMKNSNRRLYSSLSCVVRTLVVLLTTLFFSEATGAETFASTAPENVRIAFSSLSGNTAPLWVTYEQGFFTKYGLEPELVFIEGGSTTVRALASSEVALAQMAGSAAVQSQLSGSDVILIGGLINTLTFQLITDARVNHPELLKGKSVGVTRFGSSTDFATRYAFDRWGLIAQKDVNILELGSMPALLSALQSRKIHGAMLSAPSTLQAKKLGFSALADLQMLGLEYQHTGIATRRLLTKSRPDLIRNFLRAYVEGIHYLKTHRQESLAIMAKYLKTTDTEALAETYETIGLTLLPEKPYPTLKGIQVILQELSSREANAKTAKAEQFVDLSFVRELDTSGFIDRLYAATKVVLRRDEQKATIGVHKSSSPQLQEKTVFASKATPAPATSKSSDYAIGPRTESHAPDQDATGEEYIINRGDTLSKLAELYYGTQSKWGKIYQANKHTVKNPHFLYIGQRIIIPPA
jgi:NitT/TauT family transport system substrate-binding protein